MKRTAPLPPIPKRPLFEWNGFGPFEPESGAALDGLPHRQFVTSGRAALFWALRMTFLRAPGRRHVLVPTYHCPSLIGAVLAAGGTPVFYAIGFDGLPAEEDLRDDAAALVVCHLFGHGRSLKKWRTFCDATGIALIEDCAHTLMGDAGERGIGHWGDFAVASLSKFTPAPELGLLASPRELSPKLALRAPTLRAQAAGIFRLF